MRWCVIVFRLASGVVGVVQPSSGSNQHPCTFPPPLAQRLAEPRLWTPSTLLCVNRLCGTGGLH